MPESGRGERIALEHIGVLRGKQKTRQAVVKIDPSHPQSTSEKDRVESQVTSPDVEVRPLPTIHLIQNSMGDQCDLIHKVDDSGAGGTKPIDHHVKIMSEDHCCDLKSKYKKKHSSGAILQLNEHQQATDFIQTSKSLSSSRKVVVSSDALGEVASADGVDSGKIFESQKARASSMSSLTSFNIKRMRPQYIRSHSRKSLIRGRPPEAEPEIEEVDTPSSCSGEGLEEAEMGGNADQSNDSGQTKSNIFFFTRYKLERGTMSAFRREARHIIARDLPYITHPDNIIRVWTHRDQSQLLAASSKHRPNIWFSFRNLDIKFKYIFQHPYLRLFVCYFVIFCNFLVFAEDPLSHSKTEADIPVVGNVFSFVITKYPPDWKWQFLKVTMWMLAIGCGMVVGKTIIHSMILSRFLRLKMFRADQGSWMVQFFTVIVSLYLFSHAYNVILVLTYPASKQYTINSEMGVTNSSLMKAAACGTWLGDLITALIVTDMMLQDNFYPGWAPKFRKIWRSHNALRIGVFWFGSIVVSLVVIMIIATDWITWDRLNRDFVSSTELSRAFLCSFVLVMDLMIVMQDWDFPHFTNTLDVNLPGFYKHEVVFPMVELQISGKWFNYGIIFLVMIFDLNMWKNQIFYYPEAYGQYTAMDYRVYTVTNETILQSSDPVLWSYASRSQIDPETMLPYMDEDLYMNSKFMGYSIFIKSTSFIPCVVGFAFFFTLIAVYGRLKAGPSEQDANKTDL